MKALSDSELVAGGQFFSHYPVSFFAIVYCVATQSLLITVAVLHFVTGHIILCLLGTIVNVLLITIVVLMQVTVVTLCFRAWLRLQVGAMTTAEWHGRTISTTSIFANA